MEEIDILDKRIDCLQKKIDNIDSVVNRYMKMRRKKFYRKVVSTPKSLITVSYRHLSKL